MSTKPPSVVRPFLLVLPLLLPACAGAPSGAPAASFSRIGPAPASARPLRLQANSAQAAAPSPVAAAAGPAEVQARIAAFLQRAGFRLEATRTATGVELEATRMGPPADLQGEATCPLQALRRPAIAAAELSVRLAPAAEGTRVEALARFAEVETRLLSGDLARTGCRSSGALEAAVRAAARGG